MHKPIHYYSWCCPHLWTRPLSLSASVTGVILSGFWKAWSICKSWCLKLDYKAFCIFVCMFPRYLCLCLQVLGRGTMVRRRVFPARRRIWASSRWGRVTTERPSTASNRSPGRIWPLLAAGLLRRTVTNRWGRSEAAEKRTEKHLLTCCVITCWLVHTHVKLQLEHKTPSSPKTFFLMEYSK